MLKSLDKIIAILIVITLVSVLFNVFITKLIIVLTTVLIIKIIAEKRVVPIVTTIVVSALAIYNYFLSKEYFYLELDNLDKYSNRDYMIRIILFLSMIYIFSNKEMLKGIYDQFKGYVNITIAIVSVYQVVILLLLATGNGILEKWGMNVFVGLNGSPHGNTYLMILLAVVIEWIINEKGNNKFLLLYIVPFITAFISGARTPGCVMLGLFLAIRLFKEKELITKILSISWKRLMIISFAASILIISSTFIIEALLNSNIVEKFVTTSEEGNVLNSRDRIWGGIITDYKYDFSDKEKVLGHGIHYTVVINNNNVNSQIWGHSDFIDILVSYGAIMLFIYIAVYMWYFIEMYRWGKRGILTVSFFIAMMLLSTFNGVINYTVFIPIVIFWGIFYISIVEKEEESSLDTTLELEG